MARSRPARWPPRTSPAADGVADRSRRLRVVQAEERASKSAISSRNAPHRDTDRPGTPRSASKYSSTSQRSAGTSVTRSSPRSNASHSCSGESMPPGRRQAIPITATGVTMVQPTEGVLHVRVYPSGANHQAGASARRASAAARPWVVRKRLARCAVSLADARGRTAIPGQPADQIIASHAHRRAEGGERPAGSSSLPPTACRGGRTPRQGGDGLRHAAGSRTGVRCVRHASDITTSARSSDRGAGCGW